MPFSTAGTVLQGAVMSTVGRDRGVAWSHNTQVLGPSTGLVSVHLALPRALGQVHPGKSGRAVATAAKCPVDPGDGEVLGDTLVQAPSGGSEGAPEVWLSCIVLWHRPLLDAGGSLNKLLSFFRLFRLFR